MWEAVANVEPDNTKPARLARVSVGDRTTWKTKRIAEKHAREYKAWHLQDAGRRTQDAGQPSPSKN